MKKISEWLKRKNVDKDLRSKTHKAFNDASIYQDETKLLAAKGIGTISVQLETPKAFNLDLIATNALLRLMVNQRSVKFYCIYKGRFILLKEDHSEGVGLESDPDCTYWLSFEAGSRKVLYGKNQPNFESVKLVYSLPESNKTPEQYWMNSIAEYRIDTPSVIRLSKGLVKEKA